MKIKGIKLAELAGLHRSMISKEVKRGNLEQGADKLYDIENQKNKNWCISHGVNLNDIKVLLESGKKPVAKSKKKAGVKVVSKKKSPKPKTKPKSKPTPKKIVESEIPEQFDDFEALTGLPEHMLSMTIKDLVLTYGAPNMLKTFVDILAKIMDAYKKDVDIQEKRKTLVPRRFVEFLKSYIDVFNNQLFDYAEGSTSKIISIVIADPEKAKIKIPEMQRKEYSKMAKETIKIINKDIKNLKVKETKTEVDE